MPKYTVHGYISASVVARVEAKDEAEARKKAEGLDAPSEVSEWHPYLEDGFWHFNGWDDVNEEAVQEVELDDEEDADHP